MGFLKQLSGNEIVYIINDKIIEDKIIKKIIKDINPDYKIGFDMRNVKSLSSALFLKYLNCNKYKLYNLQNEVLTYLSIVIKSGRLKSYMNYEDFKNNKRELIKRRFSVV